MTESLHPHILPLAEPALTVALYREFSSPLIVLWQQALARTGAVEFFQHPAWHAAYYQARRHTGREAPEPVIAVVSDALGPVAILPFARVRRSVHGLPLRVLELMRPCDMGVRNLVLAEGVNVSAIWRQWLQALSAAGISWDMLDMGDILAQSDAMRLAEAAPRSRVSYYHHDSNRLASSGEAARLRAEGSKGHLKKTRKKGNALGKQGVLEYRLVTDEQGLREALEHYVEIEDSGWKGGTGLRTSMRHDEPQLALYKTLMQWRDAHYLPVAALMLLDDRPIAVKLCAEVGRTLFMLKIAYSDTYRDQSPGNVLLSWLLEQYQARDDMDHVSFITSGDWTLRWHPEKQPAYHVQVFNHTLRGLAGGVVAKAVNTAREYKRRQRASAAARQEDQQDDE